MIFTFHLLTLRDAREAARWRFPGQYAYYNHNPATMLLIWFNQRIAVLAHRPIGSYCYSVHSEHGELVGLFYFTSEYDPLVIGLAMRPDLTGRGNGLEFVLAGLEFARRTFAPQRFSLSVAMFNQRARRVYERAGFQPVKEYTRIRGMRLHKYLLMVRDA